MSLALPWRSQPAAPPPEPARYEQPSLALDQIIARLGAAPRCGVLDLGSPTAANLALYAREGATITFADLHRFHAPTRVDGNTSNRFNESFPKTPMPVDVILAWDLFDYLSLDETTWLGQCLNQHCAPGAMVHALVSSQGPIPETPSFFTIANDKTLIVQESGPLTRTSPEHSEHTLLGALRDLTVKSRFQLRRATVEYLFCWA